MTANIDKDLEKLLRVQVGLPRSDDAPFEVAATRIEPGPYYVNIEERIPELAQPEAPEHGLDELVRPKLAVDRRDFMRLFSASALAGTAAACVRRPVEKAIPYVNQPIDQIPGVAVTYATSGDGVLANGIIVKTREGRPTKIEGNPEHPMSQGATDLWDQAALQALYHPERKRSPRARYGNNKVDDVTWDEAFGLMSDRIKAANGKVAFLTRGTTGSQTAFYRQFLKAAGASEDQIYTYEPNSLFAEVTAAHELAFGVGGIPRTELHRTKMIVGVGTCFLEQGIAPVYETKSFVGGHAFKTGEKGIFVQFESRLTGTGGKATTRHVIGLDDELAVTLLLVEQLIANPKARGSKSEHEVIQKVLSQTAALRKEVSERLGFDNAMFAELAEKLLKVRSIVMVGTSGATSRYGTQVQLAGIMANVLINSYGKTQHFDRGWINPPVKPHDLQRFLKDAKDISVLFIVDCNPAFEIPEYTGIKDELKKVKSVFSFQTLPNETDAYAELMVNHNHFLESWGDAHTVAGFWSMRQPVVRTQYNSKQIEDILLWVAAKMDKPMGYGEYRDYLVENWKRLHGELQAKVDFDTFFKAIQRRGFVGRLERRTIDPLKDVSAHFVDLKPASPGLKLAVYLDTRLQAGKGAALPVLQEIGDPLTTVAWDTWVAINPHTVKKLGLRYNEVVTIQTTSGSLNLAVYPMPGLNPDVVAIPRGNGHLDVSKVSHGVGENPLPLLVPAFDALSGYPVTAGDSVTITSTKKIYRLCAQQKHNDLANRTDIVKKIPLKKAAADQHKKLDLDGQIAAVDLYPALEKGQHTWGMSVDLDKCDGCGICMVACSQENNVPQVGREQILLGREMHWIRLDRYFAGPVDNPTVTFQPIMCQHCNHAPCEAVCPVFATTHDAEGMNAMTYNRCVGTRYCANACPYKVRRFNWYTYQWNIIGDKERDRNIRALNPDVTVRTKGVMEKCSFCVQRLREAKHKAKERNPTDPIVKDGEVQVACQQACPSEAIQFGNLQDKRSRVSKLRSDNRSYLLLGADPSHGHYGLKTQPNVNYLAYVEHDGTLGSPSGGPPEGMGDGHGSGDGHGHPH